ncbi:sarcoplasmic calcium-binding protein-like, partial [Lingula anatina]
SQSGVWATKLRRFARLFDSDGDGILTKAEAVGQLVQEVQSALDSETADEITDTIAEAWSSVFVIPDSGIDIDSAAILAIGNAVCNNDDRKRKLRIWARSVFSESDSDLSCKLSRAEHGLTFGMNHVTQSALAASFDAADADGSGEITKAEFLGAMIGYFCNKSEDSALFGP